MCIPSPILETVVAEAFFFYHLKSVVTFSELINIPIQTL